MGVRESSSVCCDCPEHHEERRHKQTPVHSAEITEVQWGKKLHWEVSRKDVVSTHLNGNSCED